MATKQYVMTVMAANRVGILAALATALDELGGGFVDLSQAIMRDYFTIIMAVEFPVERSPEVIVDHLRAVGRPFGMDVLIRDPENEPRFESATEQPTVFGYLLRMRGKDCPGLLRRVSLRLAQDGIDITDLFGERNDQQGTFETCLALQIPLGVDVTRLQSELDQLLRGDGVSLGIFRQDVLQAVSEPQALVIAPRPRTGAVR